MSEKKSDYELDERATEAKFVLNNPVFQDAVQGLREQYIKQLMGSKIGSEDATVSHAKLIILEEIIAQIGSAMTDQKMQRQRRPNYGT
jgi:hypothetical protein